MSLDCGAPAACRSPHFVALTTLPVSASTSAYARSLTTPFFVSSSDYPRRRARSEGHCGHSYTVKRVRPVERRRLLMKIRALFSTCQGQGHELDPQDGRPQPSYWHRPAGAAIEGAREGPRLVHGRAGQGRRRWLFIACAGGDEPKEIGGARAACFLFQGNKQV